MLFSDILVVDYEATCAAGSGLDAIREAFSKRRSGLRRNDFMNSELDTWIGRVEDIDSYQWRELDPQWHSRNNALIDIGLRQGSFLASLRNIQQRCDSKRIGVIMGSSTSSIDRSEAAYRDLDADARLKTEYKQQTVLNPHAPGLFVAHMLGLQGPHLTINTACSSSAKVFASAARWLATGIVDAVLVGGADTLCLSVLHGFHSLQLVAPTQCRPFDANRDGINIGEAAAFALLVRSGEGFDHCGIRLSGFGESSDAHHMSHPHPEGAGARLAIQSAMEAAHLEPHEIGYINLHGTASRANDHIEGNLIGTLFDCRTISSATKGWTGHTLGAAGILESIFAMEALRSQTIPGTLNLQTIDPEIDVAISTQNQASPLSHVMSNSFGFGGNNACLIFSHAQ